MKTLFQTPDNLYEQFEKIAQIKSLETALIEPTDPLSHRYEPKIWTYSAFHQRVIQHQDLLIKRGFETGDKVLVVLPASGEMYALVSALFANGVIPVFIDHTMDKKQFLKAIHQVALSGVIADPKLLKYWLAIRGLWRPKRFSLESNGWGYKRWNSDESNSSHFQNFKIDANSTGLITFTSGSSGTPKAANRTNKILFAQREISRKLWTEGKDDIELTLFPMVVFSNLLHGIPTVLPHVAQGMAPAQLGQQLIRQIQQHGVNRMALQPSFLKSLLDVENPTALKCIKKLVVGGATVPNWLILQSQKTLPNCEGYVVYGSTEAEPISHSNFNDILTKSDNGYFVGSPIDEIQLKIENEEIYLSGPHVVQSYLFGSAENTSLKIRDTKNKIWHRTKDLGERDANGNITLTGRSMDQIQYNGQFTPSFKIEHPVENIIQSRAAIIQHNKQLALFLQAEQRSSIESKIKEVLEKSKISPDKVMLHWNHRIPVDNRHHWRIDRNSLTELI